jgi:hypothetical protein
MIYPSDCRRGCCDAVPHVRSTLGCVRFDDDTDIFISGLELFSLRATSWPVVILYVCFILSCTFYQMKPLFDASGSSRTRLHDICKLSHEHRRHSSS